MQGNMGGIIYKPNGIPIVTPNPNVYAEDAAEAAELARAREWDAWAEGLIRPAFFSAFGREAMPEEVGALMVSMRVYPAQAALMPCALRAAAMRGAKSPVPYTRTIYSDYATNCLLTAGEVEEFELMQTLQRDGEYREEYRILHEKIEKRCRDRLGLPMDDDEYNAYLRGEG